MNGITHDCARCGRVMTRPEGLINEMWLCHPDDSNLPDCYTLTSHEMSEMAYAFSDWLETTR